MHHNIPPGPVSSIYSGPSYTQMSPVHSEIDSSYNVPSDQVSSPVGSLSTEPLSSEISRIHPDVQSGHPSLVLSSNHTYQASPDHDLNYTHATPASLKDAFVPTEVTEVEFENVGTKDKHKFSVRNAFPLYADWEDVYSEIQGTPDTLIFSIVPDLLVMQDPETHTWMWAIKSSLKENPTVYSHVVQKDFSTKDDAERSAKIFLKTLMNEAPKQEEADLIRGLFEAWVEYNTSLICSRQAGYDVLVAENGLENNYLLVFVAWGSDPLKDDVRFEQFVRKANQPVHDLNPTFKKYTVDVEPHVWTRSELLLRYVRENQEGLGYWFDGLVTAATFGADSPYRAHFIFNIFRPCPNFERGPVGLSVFMYRIPVAMDAKTVGNRLLALLRLDFSMP